MAYYNDNYAYGNAQKTVCHTKANYAKQLKYSRTYQTALVLLLK